MTLNSNVNGCEVSLEIEDNELLLDVLRERLGLTGTKRSCEVEVCGACTVLVDGLPMSSCTTLASEIEASTVVTIEGLADTPFFDRAAQAFTNQAAVQCGFCTPGMMLTLKALDGDQQGAAPNIPEELSGNLCRCTGYRSILAAAEELLG